MNTLHNIPCARRYNHCHFSARCSDSIFLIYHTSPRTKNLQCAVSPVVFIKGNRCTIIFKIKFTITLVLQRFWPTCWLAINSSCHYKWDTVVLWASCSHQWSRSWWLHWMTEHHRNTSITHLCDSSDLSQCVLIIYCFLLLSCTVCCLPLFVFSGKKNILEAKTEYIVVLWW